MKEEAQALLENDIACDAQSAHAMAEQAIRWRKKRRFDEDRAREN